MIGSWVTSFEMQIISNESHIWSKKKKKKAKQKVIYMYNTTRKRLRFQTFHLKYVIVCLLTALLVHLRRVISLCLFWWCF